MKIILLLVILLAFATTGSAQTKKIAHRSHSGKESSFTIFSADNFGETPEMMEAARKKKEAEKMKADSIARQAAADSMAKLRNEYKVKTKTKNKDGKIITITDTVKKHR